MGRSFLLILHVISLVLLGFGWVLDVLHIHISAQVFVNISLFDEKRSVLGMLQTLWDAANYWPFTLIFLFGIIVPLIKSALIFYLLLHRSPDMKWQRFVNAISKWAMADVFAIGIFVAFLGANAMENTQATLQTGFYCFSAYVLLSALVAALLPKLLKNSGVNQAY